MQVFSKLKGFGSQLNSDWWWIFIGDCSLLPKISFFQFMYSPSYLGYCNNITDQAVIRMLERMPRLHRVDITNTNITESTKSIIIHALNARRIPNVILKWIKIVFQIIAWKINKKKILSIKKWIKNIEKKLIWKFIFLFLFYGLFISKSKVGNLAESQSTLLFFISKFTYLICNL